MEWQPISTAPKNGEKIILWFPRHGAFEAHWHQPGDLYKKGRWVQWGHNYQDPTHWMPKPKSPQDEVSLPTITFRQQLIVSIAGGMVSRTYFSGNCEEAAISILELADAIIQAEANRP